MRADDDTAFGTNRANERHDPRRNPATFVAEERIVPHDPVSKLAHVIVVSGFLLSQGQRKSLRVSCPSRDARSAICDRRCLMRMTIPWLSVAGSQV
jgi:hypothetical protein